MLEKIDLNKKMSKQEYSESLPKIEAELGRLQRECKDLDNSLPFSGRISTACGNHAIPSNQHYQILLFLSRLSSKIIRCKFGAFFYPFAAVYVIIKCMDF